MADDAPAARATRSATAHDGLEAVEAAEQFRPEVILMDVGMPRLNGLRRDPAHPRAAVGQGRDDHRPDRLGAGGRPGAASREAGCDGHLVKPVNLPDLQKLLGEVRSG